MELEELIAWERHARREYVSRAGWLSLGFVLGALAVIAAVGS